MLLKPPCDSRLVSKVSSSAVTWVGECCPSDAVISTASDGISRDEGTEPNLPECERGRRVADPSTTPQRTRCILRLAHTSFFEGCGFREPSGEVES